MCWAVAKVSVLSFDFLIVWCADETVTSLWHLSVLVARRHSCRTCDSCAWCCFVSVRTSLFTCHHLITLPLCDFRGVLKAPFPFPAPVKAHRTHSSPPPFTWSEASFPSPLGAASEPWVFPATLPLTFLRCSCNWFPCAFKGCFESFFFFFFSVKLGFLFSYSLCSVSLTGWLSFK